MLRAEKLVTTFTKVGINAEKVFIFEILILNSSFSKYTDTKL